MCPPMLFKLCPCIQKLCNVHYPPTPSLGWIGQIKGRSLSLASARSASWLAYSLHPRSLTPIWSWMQGCTKPMRTHAHPKPMGMGMGTQCRSLLARLLLAWYIYKKPQRCLKGCKTSLLISIKSIYTNMVFSA